MKKLTLFVLLLSQVTLFAQNYKFGKVSKEELQEKFYPLDSTAKAAVLYKNKEVFVEYTSSEGWQLVTLVHKRVKFYNKNGFKHATEEVRMFQRGGTDETVTGIKAYTYNLEGKKVVKDKLSKKHIFEKEISKNWFSKSFTMPNVKAGSIIEYKYRKTSPYFKYVDKIDFQYEIPIKKIDVLVKIPEYFVYKTHYKGYLQLYFNESMKHKRINYSYREERNGVGTQTTKYEKSIDLMYKFYELSKENIPGIKINEPYISSINNYKSSVNFELNSVEIPNSRPKYYSNSWEAVAKRIYRTASFGEEINKSSYYKKDLEKILLASSSQLDKVSSIFQFVKSKVKWNGQYGKYTRKGVRKAYKERAGNVAEINLMLTSMLRSAGLKSNPVLVSTRKNGIPLFPTIDGFNYVISMVEFDNGSYILLDATEIYSMPNILPERVLNWNGRKVTKEGLSTEVKLTPSKHSLEEHNILVQIDQNLNVKGLIRSKFGNLNALNFRKTNNQIKEESLINNLEDGYNIIIESHKVLNEFDLGKLIIRNIKFKSDNLIEGINNKIYIEPLLFLTKHTNPFKLENRNFPVDYTSPWKEKISTTFKIPKGYNVESLPKPMAIGLPDNLGVFKYQVTQKGEKISTLMIMQLNTPIVTPEYYSALKEFYAKMIKKQSEKIVLSKI